MELHWIHICINQIKEKKMMKMNNKAKIKHHNSNPHKCLKKHVAEKTNKYPGQPTSRSEAPANSFKELLQKSNRKPQKWGGGATMGCVRLGWPSHLFCSLHRFEIFWDRFEPYLFFKSFWQSLLKLLSKVHWWMIMCLYVVCSALMLCAYVVLFLGLVSRA